MSLDDKVSSADMLAWGEKRVNLSSESAAEYRAQGDNLKERLEKYIEEHPDFDLVKMLNSGSVAKGTALRTTSDMDVAVYVRRAAAPQSTPDLVGWLRDRLREAYGKVVPPDRITSDEACVRISFSGSGVDVECVPILYDDDPDDYGELILRSGDRVRTSIRKHLEFVRKRKNAHVKHFAQFVRFLKYWRKNCAQQDGFALGAFAVELLAAHIVDSGTDPSNYPQALQDFFAFVVRGGLSQRIVFTDNYQTSKAIDDNMPVRIIDPVAPENNVTKNVTTPQRGKILEAAAEALDDVTIARTATTKEAAIAAWRGVFGPEFSI